MSQTNVNTGGGGRVVERDGSGEGFSMGMIMAILLGFPLRGWGGWWAIFEAGWFGPAAPGGSTNVNVTQQQPSNPSGSTSGGSGTTGGTGSTTGGSTSGGTTGGSRGGR